MQSQIFPIFAKNRKVEKMDIWQFIFDQLNDGHRVMLMVVADASGSTPGRPGFKMAVSESGALAGSIGGGVMEFNMVNIARQWLADGEAEPVAIRQVHDSGAGPDSSGLLCAGEQTNLFYPLDKASLELVEAIAVSHKNGETGILYMHPDYLGFDREEISESRIDWEISNDREWTYTEYAGIKPVLYIFGGGHLSLSISQLFHMLGFTVKVFDDRSGLNTMDNNTFAHEKAVIDYNKAGDYVESGPHSYVAIMTVSHVADELILGQMIQKELKYLGMIGSKKKVKTIFDALRAKGASEEQLNRVDSPMGIPINSQTVPEIAVSIAARVILIKNI
jgi:xanthine dehydrogenase accessory factor